DAVVLVLERRAAGAVAYGVRAVVSDRRRRSAPRSAALVIGEVDGIADRVAHRVVVPGREAEEVAALDPGESRAPLGDDEATARVRDDVGPRCRGHVVAAHPHLVVSRRREPPESILE